jgi:hypothetical protein
MHHPTLFLRRILFVCFLIINILFFTAPLYAAAPCRLSFGIYPGEQPMSSGATSTWRVVVKNTGSGMCRDVAYSIFYSDNERFVSSSSSPRAGNYYWHVGNLAVGKASKMNLVIRHAGGTEALVTEGCASARGAADACSTARAVVRSESPSAAVPAVSVSSSAVAVAGIVASKKEKGIWIWNFPSQMITQAADIQMAALARYGFNAAYITIDDYVDIVSMPEGERKQEKKKQYFSDLASVVRQANSYGLTVDAEGGAHDWATPANRWKGFALLDAVKDYNALYPDARLRGIQYDVEPHTLPDYETNKTVRLYDYIEFIDQSVSRLASSDVRLSIVIPHFFDGKQEWTPFISYGGTSVSTFDHLLGILDKKEGSSIVVMSYRNFFDGPNGTKEVSMAEVEEASQGTHRTTILIAQETGNVQPVFVTHFGQTKAELFSALAAIESSFGSYSNYGGTATHYLDPFLLMKD